MTQPQALAGMHKGVREGSNAHPRRHAGIQLRHGVTWSHTSVSMRSPLAATGLQHRLGVTQVYGIGALTSGSKQASSTGLGNCSMISKNSVSLFSTSMRKPRHWAESTQILGERGRRRRE